MVTNEAGVTTASGETVTLPAEPTPVVVQEIVTPPITLPEEPVPPVVSPQPVSEADKKAGKEILKDCPGRIRQAGLPVASTWCW